MNQFRTSEEELKVLTPEAVSFLIALGEEFRWRRGKLLEERDRRQARILAGEVPAPPPETAAIREGDWQVAPVPADLRDRRVEITGPVDRKMMINALNSGARVFMADFEDATTPTWSNLLRGHINLMDVHDGTIEVQTDEKTYRLDDEVATLVVRPRGWHLAEKHFLVDDTPMSAALFDFGLYFFHCAARAIERGSGPYFYLPKLESHMEARLWNDVFVWAQDRLGIPNGTIKATVLVENVLAAFEMDEILYELRDHAAGLNAGRWDYIFSVIKTFRHDPRFVLPDRSLVTMTVPFMAAYAEQLVETCHRRGAHAIGGMAAFIPDRRSPEVTERAIDSVRNDKRREANMGYDGTWVAHPGLVEVAAEEFDAVLVDAPHQIGRALPQSVAGDLLDVSVDGGVTLDGVHTNVSVGIRYLASWLSGVGAAAIDNLMEDVATAEISRSQIWQWVHHGVVTTEGVPVTETLVRDYADEVVAEFATPETEDKFHTARKVFELVALEDDFIDFLTLPAYELIN